MVVSVLQEVSMALARSVSRPLRSLFLFLLDLYNV